jgi:hypothetical protein
LAAFTLLPPAAALDLLLIVLLLVAAHGAYGLARRFGANRLGAVVAGLAFAGSGYIASQLKHLSIISTVVWLPFGLLIDSALASAIRRARRGRRALSMALFGLVFAEQYVRFPQSAHICAPVYGAFALFRTLPTDGGGTITRATGVARQWALRFVGSGCGASSCSRYPRWVACPIAPRPWIRVVDTHRVLAAALTFVMPHFR